MTIHQRIKERRLALGMKSHQALAERVGVKWQTVQLWEKEEGGTAPNRNRMPAVAAALETTAEWLIFGDQGTVSAIRTAAQGDYPPPTRMQWVSDEEDELLSLYRTTDAEGRSKIKDTAQAMPKILRPFVINNKS